MNVLFVINNLYLKGNGLCSSARRTIKKLREAGVNVKVLSAGYNPKYKDNPDFNLGDYVLPIFGPICKKQGYSFAKVDKKVIEKAVKWADVVHLDEPFAIQMATAKIAKKYHKPCTGSYHLHPENLFCSVHLGNAKVFNQTTMRFFRDHVYNHCLIVQCPTQSVKERLERYRFKADLRVISNGLVMDELKTIGSNITPKRVSDAKYQVITIGRYSAEKDIKTLLKAMKYSKYHDDIQLVLAGQGPKEKSLKKRADRLVKKGYIKYSPSFGFYPLTSLQELSLASDLYIHCAYIEVEGLSCMEAIQIGLVPIIASGRYTATSQFALNEKSVFPARNPKALASRIDYWLEHEKERKEEAKKYVGIGSRYNIDYSIVELVKMLEDAYKLGKKSRQN